MAKKNEAKVKFSAETKEFNDAIKQSNKEISVLKSELKLNAAEMKNAGTSTEALGKKHQLLKKEQEAQRDKTKALNAQLQSAKHIFGEDSQEVANLTKKLNASKIAESNLDKQIRDTNDELKQQQKQMVLSGEASEKLKSGLDKAGNASGAIAGAVGALTVASTATAVEQEVTLDKLQSQLGLTESQMKSYDKVAREVYKGNYGNELQDVTNAIAEIRYQLGKMTDSELTNVTKNALTLDDVFDMDVKESTRAVNSMMKQFNITADDAYNLIVQGAQNGLNQNDDLLDTINEYSVQFKNAGYSADDMFNMLANGTASGTWSVDKLGDAVKEMNIRFSDGTVKNALSENRGALGLTRKEIEQLQKGFNEGGESAKYALQTTMGHLGAVKDESKRYQIGVSIFGTMWEDLGETTVRSLVNTEGAIRKTNNAMSKVDSLAYDNVATDIQMAKREFEELGKDILQDIGPEIREFADWAQDNGDEIVTTIKTIGVVAGTTFAINKTVKFGRSLADISKFGAGVVKSVKAMALARAAETTATEAQTVAQNGLNASMLASPIGLTIASVTALAAGIVYLNEKYKETSEETKQFIEEQKLKSDEAKSALEELTSSVKEHDEEVNRTYDTYESQLEQLDNIVDKDGKIKKGKEELAALITGELSEASGIEIEIIDGQIQQYQNLEEQIKKTIKQKRIAALLEAGKDDWIQAQQTREEYETKVYDQKNVVNTAEKELKEAQETRDAYLNQNGLKRLQQELFYKTGTSTKKNLDEAREKYNSAIETYNNTLATYESAGDTIGRYESLLAASTSKSTKEINTALAGYTNNMKNATSATTSELILQVNTTEEKLKEVKKKYDKGEVSKSVLNEYRRMKRYAKQQLDLKLEDTKNEQSKEVEQYQKDDVPNAAADNAKKTVDVVQGTLKLANFSTEGKKSANTFTQEYTDNKGKKAGGNILDGISKKFGSANFSVDGNNAVNTFLNEFTGIKGINAGKTVAKGVNSGLRDYLKKNPFNLDVSLNAKIKTKNKNLKDLQEIMLGGVANNAKGNIIKNPILTTFAEDGPEAAIPINDKPRSKALWLQTGQMMGMINTRVGERAISHEIDLRETNTLLRRIASKDPNMYMDSMQVSKATSKARDIVDGMESILIGRGVARE